METTKTDELTGTAVLVNPELANDPASRQGQIGIVTSASLERDDIYVTFGSGPLALYGSDALMVLRHPKDIYRELLSRSRQLDRADFKILFQISLLQDYGASKSIKTAIGLAIRSRVTREIALVSLQQKFDIHSAHLQSEQSQITFKR